MTETFPDHYNEVADHFIRRFESLANDIFDRVDAYNALPHNVDIDPNYPNENEIAAGSDGIN